MFAIIKGIDTSATITSASGMQIKSTKDFPKGKKFSDAFKPIQSINTKSVMKQMFAIIKDIDTSTTISSALLACRLSQQKKFSDAFKSIQSINTKSVKMVFRVSTSTPFLSIKCRHTHLFLMDFLRAKNMADQVNQGLPESKAIFWRLQTNSEHQHEKCEDGF